MCFAINLIPLVSEFSYNAPRFVMGFEPVFYLWAVNMDVVKLVETTVNGLGYELVDLERSDAA